MAPGILDGIRILDMSSGMSGPMATTLLAEAGADVIKIEPPGGERARPFPGFRTWNRSKRDLVLDLRDAADRATLDRLLATADVLVHGLRPSVARRHGLDDARLHPRFPRLITCAVLGYPIDHPDAERPGYEALVMARLGLMDEQRGHRPGPIFYRLPIGSCGATHLAIIGILARLHARERTGRGGAAHTSLMQGALAPIMQYWARASRPTPSFAWNLPKNMLSGLWECGDGLWVHVIGVVENVPFMQKVLADLRPDEIADARRDLDARGLISAPNQLDPAAVKAAFLRHDRETWCAELRAADVAIHEVLEPGQLLELKQARLNGYAIEVDDPEAGRVWQAGAPVHVEPPLEVRSPAPALDAHGAALRTEVGATRAPEPAPPLPAETGEAPLAGLRVLDLGNFLAGPFGPMLMSDLGAEVIKLEAPTGDRMRYAAERSFAGCQRGKRGIALDLKNPASRPVLEQLVRRSDVVHHNLRYPAALKLRVDYDSIAAIHPEVVYCHCSGYGPRGERKDWPSYDQMFQACSGWEAAGGGQGNPPVWHRVGMMDHQNAMASVEAVLLGLRERARTGRGQFVRSSLLGGAAITVSETYLRADGTLADFPPLDRQQMGISPAYRMYALADGWIVVAALDPGQLETLTRIAGAEGPDEIAEALRPRKLGELLRALERAGIPAEEVRQDAQDDFFDAPEHRVRRLVVDYPSVDQGHMEQIGALWCMGDLDLEFPRAAPGIGEHTREILCELGFGERDIDALHDAGAIAFDDAQARAARAG